VVGSKRDAWGGGSVDVSHGLAGETVMGGGVWSGRGANHAEEVGEGPRPDQWAARRRAVGVRVS
jgi:hypothetical protein